MLFIRNIALRIYGGPLATGLNEEPLVAAGTVPEEFRAIPPTIVDETQTWIITHAQNYTLYALHTRACKTSDGQPGQMQTCLLLPTQQRLADGKSPLEVLNSVSAAFSIQAMMGGDVLPDTPVDSSPYQNLLRRYRLEARPTSLPVMNGPEAAAYCVENMTQLEALMRHSRYPELGHVGRLELGTHCQSTIALNTKAAARPAKPVNPIPTPTPTAPPTAPVGASLDKPDATVVPPTTGAVPPAGTVPPTGTVPPAGSLPPTGGAGEGPGDTYDIPDFIKAIQKPSGGSGQPSTPRFTPPPAPSTSTQPSTSSQPKNNGQWSMVNGQWRKWLFAALGLLLAILLFMGIKALISKGSGSGISDEKQEIADTVMVDVPDVIDEVTPEQSEAEEIGDRLKKIAEEEAKRRAEEEAKRKAEESEKIKEKKVIEKDDEGSQQVIQEEPAPAPKRAGKSAAQEELLRLINDDEVKLWTCRTSDGYNNTLNRKEQLAVDAVKRYYDENTKPIVDNILQRYKPFRSIDEVVRAANEIKEALKDF